MKEVELETELFLTLKKDGDRITEQYPPSEDLQATLSSLHDRWHGYVGSLNDRCDELMGFQGLWRDYEGKVKELLSWIMSEAESFSAEVTTKGDKGVEDHIASCKVGGHAHACSTCMRYILHDYIIYIII